MEQFSPNPKLCKKFSEKIPDAYGFGHFKLYDDISKDLNYKKDNLIGLKDVQLKVNDLLNFGFLLNEPTDNDDELVSILLGIGQTDLKLDDIRFNVNINLRKDTTGGAIEGKINGKWYEIETEMVVGIDGTQIKLSLTKKGKSDLAAAEAAAQGSDSSSSSSSDSSSW